MIQIFKVFTEIAIFSHKKAIFQCIMIHIHCSARTEDSIATPCSVKAYGKYCRPPLVSVFVVASCDLNKLCSVAFN